MKAINLRSASGWIGSICFMFSGLPSAIDAVVTKHCSVPLGTLILWTAGEIFLIYYVAPSKDLPLLSNYILNISFLLPMWYYKL